MKCITHLLNAHTYMEVKQTTMNWEVKSTDLKLVGTKTNRGTKLNESETSRIKLDGSESSPVKLDGNESSRIKLDGSESMRIKLNGTAT